MTAPSKWLQYWGLKFNPAGTDIPTESLHRSARLEAFIQRVGHLAREGGVVMVTGESGVGKSASIRLMTDTLGKVRDLQVVAIQLSQGSRKDMYQELGGSFGLTLTNNRFASFRALRQSWCHHMEQCVFRPVIVVDEAQSMNAEVLEELKTLSSKDYDSRQLMLLVLCGDQRLPEKLATPDLVPLGSRIRARLKLEAVSAKELKECLQHVLREAGNESLVSAELQAILSEHSVGNYRVMMNSLSELLFAGFQKEAKILDEKLYFEVFNQPTGKTSRSTRK